MIIISDDMRLHFVVLQTDVSPVIVRYYISILGAKNVNNTEASFSWSKNSTTLDDIREVERFICQAGAVMNGKYIDDWTASTDKADYLNYTSAMQEALLGIYLSEFQKPESNRVTGNYQLDLSDASNDTFDVVNSQNAQALEQLFTSSGYIFSVKSN